MQKTNLNYGYLTKYNNLIQNRFISINTGQAYFADNGQSPRAQPDDKIYYYHNIRGNMLQLFFFLFPTY